MPTGAIAIAIDDSEDGWVAHVTVGERPRTDHVVRISRAELERYGAGDVTDLVRRSFEFLLAREPNTSILSEFQLSVIERYFPEYTAAMNRR